MCLCKSLNRNYVYVFHVAATLKVSGSVLMRVRGRFTSTVALKYVAKRK